MANKNTSETENKKESQEKSDFIDAGKENETKTKQALKKSVKKTKTEIDENKFRDVFININKNSPSLENVAIAPKTKITLEKNLEDIPIEKKEDENVNYNSINYNNQKDKSYQENTKFHDENLIKGNSEFAFQPELGGTKKSQEDYIVKSPSNNLKEFKTHDPFQKEKKKGEFYEFR